MLAVLPGAAPVLPSSVVDHTALGYTYDTDPDVPQTEIIDLTIGAPARTDSIGQTGEVDLYRFIVATAGIYIIETAGPTDIVMSLFGPNSETALVTEDDDSGQDRNARIASSLTAGTYFLRVRHFQTAGTGTYGVSVRADAAQQPIPEILVNGPAVQGNIAVANESDMYRFAASFTGLYTIETTGSTDTFLTLFGPNSETTIITQDDDSGPELNSRIVADLSAGSYFLRIRHFSPAGTGSYSISIRR